MPKVTIEEVKIKILDISQDFYQDIQDFKIPIMEKLPAVKLHIIELAIKELILENKIEVKKHKNGKRWFRTNQAVLR